MERKRGGLLALTLAAALALSGCAAPEAEPTPTPRPTVPPTQPAESQGSFALPCCPGEGFHPIEGTNRLNLTLTPLIYRGLFAVDRNFQAQNDLCESYSVSEDGLVWTFRLKEAVFSDGTSLTAREAAQSLNTARRSERYGGRLKDLARVWAEEEAVKVSLTRPNGSLPLLLDVPIVKEGEDSQHPLGTGPYALTEGEGLSLTARQGARVPVDSIPLRAVESGDELVYAVDAREVSLVEADLMGTNALGYSGRLETTDYPTTTLLYIGCNMASGPCRDQEVRQAVALTLDRRKVADRTLGGHGVAAALPVHPDAPGYDSRLAGEWDRDPQRALELLEGRGWTRNEEGRLIRRGTELALRLIVNLDNTFKTAAAEALAADLNQLGLAVTVDKLSWEEFVSALEKGEFDLYLGETALTADFDLEALLGNGGELNYTRFWDQETWELMDRCRGAREGERKAAETALYGRVAQLAPIVPLCFKNGSLLTQWGQVTGAEPTQRDVFAGLENWVIRNS